MMLEVAAVEEVATAAEEPATSGKRERTENRFGQFERVQIKAALGEKAHPAQEATVFVAEAGACYNAIPVESAAEHFQVYHKVFPGLKTPFDLSIECFPMYEKLLEEEWTSVEIVNFMLRGPVAESTAKGYKCVVNRFHAFCAERGYTFPDFTKEAVLRFAHDSCAEGAGLAFFSKLIPSLHLLEKVLDVEKTALTLAVRAAVSGIKRELAKHRGIVKKATGYSFSIIRDLISKEVLPHKDNLERIDAGHFRSLFRAIIIYFTFCRFDEFSRLTDREVTDEGTYISIIFCRSKNHQFGDNSQSVIPERPDCDDCPVKLIRMYFQRFGLQFGGSGKLLNFRLRKEAGRHSAIFTAGICQSNATKFTRQLLAKHGYDPTGFVEKSLKVQGASNLLDTEEQLVNVMVHGRWKCQTTVLHYRHVSVQFRLRVASRIPMAPRPAGTS
jgi:hypothetical protein